MREACRARFFCAIPGSIQRADSLFGKFRRLCHRNEARCSSPAGYCGKLKSLARLNHAITFEQSIKKRILFLVISSESRWNIWQDTMLLAYLQQIKHAITSEQNIFNFSQLYLAKAAGTFGRMLCCSLSQNNCRYRQTDRQTNTNKHTGQLP